MFRTKKDLSHYDINSRCYRECAVINSFDVVNQTNSTMTSSYVK